MSMHTPGLWVPVGTWVELDDELRPDICVCNPELFGQDGDLRTHAEQRANARLIACAPAMLEIIETLYSEWEQYYDGEPMAAHIASAYEKASAIISEMETMP